jgi:hypothetical protein
MVVDHPIPPIYGGLIKKKCPQRTCVLIGTAVKLLSIRTILLKGREAIALLVGGEGS